MTTTTWPTAKRRANKALDILADASEAILTHLTTAEDRWNMTVPLDIEDALTILDAARKRVGDDLAATKKALGVGTYEPYGGRGRLRKY